MLNNNRNFNLIIVYINVILYTGLLSFLNYYYNLTVTVLNYLGLQDKITIIYCIVLFEMFKQYNNYRFSDIFKNVGNFLETMNKKILTCDKNLNLNEILFFWGCFLFWIIGLVHFSEILTKTLLDILRLDSTYFLNIFTFISWIVLILSFIGKIQIT